MAYTMLLTKPRCEVCGAEARVEVFNRFNATCGKFCKKHGAARLADLQKGELATARAGSKP